MTNEAADAQRRESHVDELAISRKVRARLDRLARDGEIERKREQGTHGAVYLYLKR